MRILSDEEIRERHWDIPIIPDETTHNDRDFYRSEEYLRWWNEMPRNAKQLHQPKVIEKRIAGILRKGGTCNQFGLLSDSGTPMQDDVTIALRNDHKLTPVQRKIVGAQLRTQEEVLALMRSLVDEDDVVRIYTTLTEQAIATGEPRLLETWLKWMVGLPAQQINVTKTDVAKMLEVFADKAEREREEYVVVDGVEVTGG